MKSNYRKTRDTIYATTFLISIIAGCEYFGRLMIKDTPKASEILPSQVTLDSKIDPCILPTELLFKGTDPSNRYALFFVDEGYNGSLDKVIISTAVDRDTINVNSPYFQEWNQKFLEMRRNRFGDR